MEFLKRKEEGKFQLDSGCQAKASHGLYAMFVKQGEGLVPVCRTKPKTTQIQRNAQSFEEIMQARKAS